MNASLLTVGYLHLGKVGSGVRRYGQIVAEAAARRADLHVISADAGDREASIADLRLAGRRLADADVIHLQWKLADWGGGVASLARLEVLLAASRRPTVVTLHDVYSAPRARDRWLDPGLLGMRRLSLTARALVVHSDEERRRLAGIAAGARVVTVPHFVEERELPMTREDAKLALGLGGRRVLTLLGFMTRRKGHRLALETLVRLPDDVFVLFAGAPIEGREARGEELEAYARELGVADRVRFTGYVPDAELERILAATDVAVCPFRDMSASGSLATWISTARPIVTSDLPAFRELDALAPGSLRIFTPLTADAAAARIRDVLGEALPAVDPGVDRLRTLLATPRIVERYVEVYRLAYAT